MGKQNQPQPVTSVQQAQVSVITPKSGETIPLAGTTIPVSFNASNLDPNKQLSYMPELVRNGMALGEASTMGFVVNKAVNPQTVGVKPGHYFAKFADQLAPAGSGYQYRITLYEGTWGQGHKVVASGLSGIFTFGSAPVASVPTQVSVTMPKAGETIPLSGVTMQVSFSASNLDPNKSLRYMPELVRNGVALGEASTMGFVVNTVNPQTVGVKPGHYLANFADHLAESGGGYQYRITIYEGTWGQAPKVVASGLSGTFTFGAAPAIGRPLVTVTMPKSGETIPLSGVTMQVAFSASGMDPNKQLFYMPELVRNGAALGEASTMGYVVNQSVNQAVVGVKPGHYLANFADHLAPSGGGYQYRITVYEGTWGQGHKVVTSGISGVFTFGSAPVLAGPPQVTVTMPKAGETIPLSGGVVQLSFSTSNMDPNKQLAYMPELVRNGVALGEASTMGYVVNQFVNKAVVGVQPGHYLANFADHVAEAGGGYQYRITVYEGTWGKGQKVVASGLSGTFSIVK